MHPIVPHPAQTEGWLHLRWGPSSLTARTGPLPEVATRAWFVDALRAAIAGRSSVLALDHHRRLSLTPGGAWGLWVQGHEHQSEARSEPPLAVDWAATWRAWVGTPAPPLTRAAQDGPGASGPQPAEDPTAWLQFSTCAGGTRIRWGHHDYTVNAPPRAVLAGWLNLCRSRLSPGTASAGLAPTVRVAAHQPAQWHSRAVEAGWSLRLLDAEGLPVGAEFRGDSEAWRQLTRRSGALRIGNTCTRAEVRRLLGGPLPLLALRRPGARRGLGRPDWGRTAKPRARTRAKIYVGRVIGGDRDLRHVRWRLRWGRTLRSGCTVQRWGAAIIMGGVDTVRRLDAQTGATLWSRRGVRLIDVPEIVGSGRDRIARLNRHTGERRWVAPSDAAALITRSGPWLWLGPGLASGGPGRTGLNLRDGEPAASSPFPDDSQPIGRRIWHHDGHAVCGTDPENRFSSACWPAQGPAGGPLWHGHGRVLYRMGTGDGKSLVGCSMQTGQLWRQPFEGPEFTEVLATRHASLGPLFLLWAPEPDGWWLSAVHGLSGSLCWRHRATRASASDQDVRLAADGQVVVVKSSAGAITGFDLSSGAVRWHLGPAAAELSLAHNVKPLAWRGLWLVARETVEALRPLDGQVVGRLDLEGLRPDHLSVLPDGGLLVAEAGEARIYDLAGHLAVLPGGGLRRAAPTRTAESL